MDKTLKIDRTKTAVVVIDLQRGIVAGERLPYSSQIVVENTAQILHAFRKNNMPIFLVRVVISSDQKDRPNPASDIPSAVGIKMPDDWSDFVPELQQENTDIVINKRQWGAFYGTELELQLRRRKIDTIVLCGISTNIGVESTARFAYEYGYNQIFVEDAMTAASKEEHESTVSKILPRIGLVRSTKEILEWINNYF